MEPDGMIHEEALESNLGVDADAILEAFEVGVGQGAGREHGRLNEINPAVVGKDGKGGDGSRDHFRSNLGTKQEGEGRVEGVGRQSEGHKCSSMLVNCSQSEGDAVGLSPIMGVGEENNLLDTAEICYDSVVLPSLPAEGNHEAQEAPVEYAETYMASPEEGEGELISTVQASPSTFFQATNMNVACSTDMTGSWEDLRSAHAESGYGTGPSSSDDASLGGGNSTEERAFVDSFCEEPTKTDGLDVGKNQGLSAPSLDDTGTNNTVTRLSSGGSDSKNEDSSSPSTKGGSREGEKRPSDDLPRREKGPLGGLSLRKVLSDPVTGIFMDDAMVAMCGHSFGSGSLQRVLETHSCLSCGASVPPETLVPNFALRAAISAYKHDDHIWQLSSMRGTKRRRDQFETREGSEPRGTTSDPSGSAENMYSDSRAKDVQFPFAVSDKVVIKGNKRTPERFFGMEAVIASQCLNGWYMVRTLDTGESVRLQYRSLQKLGEVDSPFSLEPKLLSTEQQVDSGVRQLSMDNLKGYPSVNKPASENDFESKSLANDTSVDPCIAEESLKLQSSVRESNETLENFLLAADNESCLPKTGGDPTNCSPKEGRNADNVHVVESPSKPVDRMDEEISTGKETLQGPDQDVLDAVSKKSSPDVLKSTDIDQGEPDDDQWLSTGLNHDTGASVWLKASTCCSEEPIVKDIQGQPNIASTGEDGLGGTVDIGKLPAADDTQANGNEALWTRPRRTALQLKCSATSGGFLQDSDPYRKVYTSGSRRRSIKEELVITVIPDHLTAYSKSLLKGTNNNGKGPEKTAVKGLDGGSLGTRKQGRDLKLKSAYEILQIMRKDMLKLEKQIPQNYMLRSWRVRCARWQKQVQESNTVSELGAQVRDFRYSLLLTTAGGMSDEEWDMRIAQIIDSGDVELLVSLWGRLYSDVHKWLESKPKAVSSKDVHQRSLLAAVTVNGMQEQDPKSIGGAMSSVHMTTAATLAAVDAVAEGQQDIDSRIKALLASTVKLLQQQSRSELSAVREALEWEKRHITAKLSHLEQRFANLQDTSDLNGLEYNPVHQTELSRSPHAEQFASELTDQMSQGLASVTPLDYRQGYETEEDDSDVALPTQDADGEATDMSDSD